MHTSESTICHVNHLGSVNTYKFVRGPEYELMTSEMGTEHEIGVLPMLL